tara:strand:- start:796 stop:2655 length:1860 start_codon:yes stop_codon:yes gene_type:complete
MIDTEKKYLFKLVVISFFYIIIKYLVSYFYNPDQSLFLKIISFGEKDFISYSFLAESLSRLDLSTDWNEFEKAKNIIGFPIFSLVWHSIFYILFGYYSFLILEIFFYILLIILIYKVILSINKDLNNSIIITILLFLSLEFLIFGDLLLDINFLKVVKLPIYEFLSYRFPRPLVTSTYLFAFIYFLLKFNSEKNTKVKLKYSFIFGILSFFLINSFFFIFVTCFLAILIYLILRFKQNFFSFFFQNISQILFFSLIVLLGLIIFKIQLNFTEEDYPNRIGTYAINIEEKIILLKLFFYKIFQLEIIFLIFTVLFLRFDKKFLNFKEIKNSRYDILLIFFFASLLSPFIFLILTNKAIALYQFWTTVKFLGFLYVLICVTQFFLIRLKKKILKRFVYIAPIFLILLNFTNNFIKQGKLDTRLISDKEDIKRYLIKNNNKYKNKLFYSDNKIFMHVWLALGNKNFIGLNGFMVSQNDEQFENIKMNLMKFFTIDKNDLIQMLNDDEENLSGRNQFAHSFVYKYTVNSLRYYKPLELEYSKNLQERIKNIPPIIWWYTFLPNSEKERLINKYENFKVNENLIPEIIVISNSKKNEDLKINISKYKLKEVLKNFNYTILVKEN